MVFRGHRSPVSDRTMSRPPVSSPGQRSSFVNIDPGLPSFLARNCRYEESSGVRHGLSGASCSYSGLRWEFPSGPPVVSDYAAVDHRNDSSGNDHKACIEGVYSDHSTSSTTAGPVLLNHLHGSSERLVCRTHRWDADHKQWTMDRLQRHFCQLFNDGLSRHCSGRGCRTLYGRAESFYGTDAR